MIINDKILYNIHINKFYNYALALVIDLIWYIYYYFLTLVLDII